MTVPVMSLLEGVLLLSNQHNLTKLSRYFAWTLVGLATLLTLFAYFAEVRFDRYLTRMQEANIKDGPRTPGSLCGECLASLAEHLRCLADTILILGGNT